MRAHRRDVAARDRSGERGARAERQRRSRPSPAPAGGTPRAGSAAHALDLVEQRDEVVASDARGRVVADPVGVVDLDGLQPERRRELARPADRRRPRTTRRPAGRAPASADGQRLQRVQRADPRADDRRARRARGRRRGGSRARRARPRRRARRRPRRSRRPASRSTTRSAPTPACSTGDRRRTEARARPRPCSARRACGRRPRPRASPRRRARPRSSCPARPGPTSASGTRRFDADSPVQHPSSRFRPRGPDWIKGVAMLPGSSVTPSQPSGRLGHPLRGEVVAAVARTKARSCIRGCGTVEVGSSTRSSPIEQDVDVERPRTPPDLAHPVAASCSTAIAAASSSCGVEVGVDRDDGVQEVVLVRSADRSGLVDRRHRDDAGSRSMPASASTACCRCASRSPRLEPSPRYARVTTAWSDRDAHADVVEHRRAPAGAACAPSRSRADPVVGRGTPRRSASRAARAAGSARSSTTRLTASRDRGVVDRVVEVVALPGRSRGRPRARGRPRTAAGGSAPRAARRGPRARGAPMTMIVPIGQESARAARDRRTMFSSTVTATISRPVAPSSRPASRSSRDDRVRALVDQARVDAGSRRSRRAGGRRTPRGAGAPSRSGTSSRRAIAS